MNVSRVGLLTVVARDIRIGKDLVTVRSFGVILGCESAQELEELFVIFASWNFWQLDGRIYFLSDRQTRLQ